jgi:3-isopropylmalate/(R)-2-methylmalate dehydratase small subunit
MRPFTKERGKVALLDWTDVNTDLIIPARYLKRIERTGYGPLLFADKRYVSGGAPPVDDPERAGESDPEFPLNRPEFAGATILVVGKNFGCGSSREHAVWALEQAGFRVLIAPGQHEGFADIFEGNALNNGLLAIELPEADWRKVANSAQSGQGTIAEVDLKRCDVQVIAAEGEFTVSFEIAEGPRQKLLKGLDSIGETLQRGDAISAYEQQAPAWAGGR